MTPADLRLLGRVFDAEIAAALGGLPNVYQARKSKQIDRLCDAGMIEPAKETRHDGWPLGVVFEGYRLTELGRMTYCMACGSDEVMP